VTIDVGRVGIWTAAFEGHPSARAREAAQEIEAMGEIVRDMVQRCEQIAASASTMLQDVKTTAMRYRKEGKRMFNEIESCSSATDEVRRMCETFRDKIETKAETTP